MSRKHGLTPCYRKTGEDFLVKANDGNEYQHLVIEFDPDANGFRLPTESEWEVACRAGSATRYYYGSDPKIFSHYGTESSARYKSCVPAKSLIPNAFGLFEMHGNIWEWCQDWYSEIDDTPLTDPRGPDEPDLVSFGRIYRGGGVQSVSGATNSAARGSDWPNVRYSNQGFRIARNIDSKH